MAKKRERLEIINDILKSIRDSRNSIGPTRLLYSSNLSPQMFKEYVKEMRSKGFIKEKEENGKRKFFLTDKGFEFLEKYRVILDLIGNFGL